MTQLDLIPQDWPQHVHVRTVEVRCPECGLLTDFCTGVRDDDYARAQTFIDLYGKSAQKGWSFARTMPTSPHEYAVRERCTALDDLEVVGPGPWTFEETFEFFVLLIREHGYKRKFGKTPYTYLNVQGPDDDLVRRYWTMGNPLPVTTIINRTPVDPAEQQRLRQANTKAKIKK